MFYFVDLSMSSPSTRLFNFRVPCFNTLHLVTIATGAPPLVFAVLQAHGKFGVMPETFGRASYALAPDATPEGDKIMILVDFAPTRLRSRQAFCNLGDDRLKKVEWRD